MDGNGIAAVITAAGVILIAAGTGAVRILFKILDNNSEDTATMAKAQIEAAQSALKVSDAVDRLTEKVAPLLLLPDQIGDLRGDVEWLAECVSSLNDGDNPKRPPRRRRAGG